MNEICPYSGLKVTRNPAWMNIQLDGDYAVDYFFIGRCIAVAVARGRVTRKGVCVARAIEEQLMRENLDPTLKSVYLIDVSGLTGNEMDGREEHRKLIENYTRFQSVIYYGASRILAMSIQLARKVHLVPRVTELEPDYESAVRKAVWILQGMELRDSISNWESGGLLTSPVHTIRNALGSVETRWIHNRIVHVRVYGDLDVELNARFNKEFEAELGKRLEDRPFGIVFIQDLGPMRSVSFQARRQFIDFMRQLHHRNPILELITYNATPGMVATVNLSKILVSFPVTVVATEQSCLTEIRSFVERQFGTYRKHKGKNIPRSKTPNEQLLDFISGTRWDVPGEMHIPLKESDPIRPIYDAFALIKRDLDEVIRARVQMEEDLRRLAMEAQAATKAKSEFLATMSHEIRTPLNGVIGMTELLLDSRLEPEQKQYAETIRGSGEHLMSLINDILDLSKIEAGKLDLESISFDLSKLLSTCGEAWNFQSKEKGIQFLSSRGNDVPTFVVGDPGRLRQILMNLVGNAIKFTTKGIVSILVEVADWQGTSGHLRFSIRDTGIGIAKDRQHLLFRKFNQVDSSMARKFGGSGLGLAITNQLVIMMGGEVGFTSEEGRGSEFWFTVRLQAAEMASEDTGYQRMPRTKPSLVGDYPILVVEDNIVNQKVVLNLLRNLGFQADLASDGRQALEQLNGKPYSLVFMDCQMPGMDGFEATRRIRAGEVGVQAAQTRIVAMTANAMAGDREHCLEAGMDDYISKPLTKKSLQAMLERSLNLRI